MYMIESGFEPYVAGLKHSVAKNITTHITNTRHGEIGRLGVETDFSKMPFYRFPSTTGRDAHFFVVVTDRAARRKGIAKPKTVVGRHGIGDVGKCGGTFVGGDHEIRVIVIPADDPGWVFDVAVNQIVGDIEQTLDKGLITVNDFPLNLFPGSIR